MGLGLPLQGPGWTECACMRVVREGRGVSAWSPTGWTRKRGMCMFLDPCSISGALSTAWSRPQPAKVGVEESAFLPQLYVRPSYHISSMIIITPGPMDACWTFLMVGRRLTSRSKWMDLYQPFVTSQRGTHPANSLEQGWANFLTGEKRIKKETKNMHNNNF